MDANQKLNRAVILAVIVFLLVLTVGFFAQCRDARASLPSVIFRGEKTVADWFAPYPFEKGKTWAGKTAETCHQEAGFLAVTENNGKISFTCILRVDAPLQTPRHNA